MDPQADRHYDALETRTPEARAQAQLAQLPLQIAHAKKHAPAFAGALAGIAPGDIRSRAALASLPVMRKSDLGERQARDRPFGGLATTRWGAVRRVFASPGGIYEPEGAAVDYWRLARALFAAGFRAGELVHNSFAYHFTPAGSMLESGALALGCAVFPAGTGQSEQQVEVMRDLQPDGYVGTPSFLTVILEKAEASGVALPSLKKVLVSGEAFLADNRRYLADRGIAGYQVYASADLGSIAYESSAHDGLVVDEGVLLEIVRPGTGDLVPPGEVGEVVVTLLHNPDYPLVRFATGDLSAVVPESLSQGSPCGRTNMRIKGWMGRADQSTKVRGLFVHPSQLAALQRRHPELLRVRLVVDHVEGKDHMRLRAELGGGHDGNADSVAVSLRELTKLRADAVEFARPGLLPNDGKVIDDVRKPV